MPPAVFRAGGGTIDYPRLCLDDELLIDTQTRKELQQQIARAPHDVEPVGHAQHMNRRFDERSSTTSSLRARAKCISRWTSSGYSRIARPPASSGRSFGAEP